MLLQVADLGDEAHPLRDETDNARVDVIQVAPQITDVCLLTYGAVTKMAMQVADRISMTVCGSFGLMSGEAELSASIGVACGISGEIGAEELVRQADAAMYRSKSEGRAVPVLAGA